MEHQSNPVKDGAGSLLTIAGGTIMALNIGTGGSLTPVILGFSLLRRGLRLLFK